jgi:hypothetical protein
LAIETCIATGARISEVLGLMWRNVNLDAGTIKIEQRVWHQDVGRPKSEDSKRILGIGDLVERLRAKEDGATPEAFFPTETCTGKAFLGLRCARCSASRSRSRGSATSLAWGHTPLGELISRGVSRSAAVRSKRLRSPATVTWKMSGEYTLVVPERQSELTRRIQEKLVGAAGTVRSAPAPTDVSRALADAPSATRIVQ